MTTATSACLSGHCVGLDVLAMCLLGGAGEPACSLCDHVLLVPDSETARIQECHIALGHAVLELLEDRLVARPL